MEQMVLSFWKCDGAAAGAAMVKDIKAGANANPSARNLTNISDIGQFRSRFGKPKLPSN